MGVPYVFNRDGKRVIIPKVSSISATMEWLANMVTYCQKNDIVYLSQFAQKVDDIIDEQLEVDVNEWLETKLEVYNH